MPNHIKSRLTIISENTSVLEKILKKYGTLVEKHMELTYHGDFVIMKHKTKPHVYGWIPVEFINSSREIQSKNFSTRSEVNTNFDDFEIQYVEEYILFPDLTKLVPEPEYTNK
jgi:hypothetical protein